MKILILTDVECAVYSQPFNLAQALAASGIESFLATNAATVQIDPKSKVELLKHQIPGRWAYCLAILRGLYCSLKLRPDAIIGVNESMIHLVWIIRLLVPFRMRFGLYFLDYWEDDKNILTWRLRFGRMICHLGMNWVDFVVDCEELRLRRRPWISDSTATMILHNFPPNSPLREEVSHDVPTIIYAGAGHKGVCIEGALRALARVELPFLCKLFLRASTTEIASLETLARELGIQPKVIISPAIPKSQLTEEYARSDIGFSFYRTDEMENLNTILCSPNKVYEYISHGLALVVSSNPTLKFVETDGFGICVNPDDIDSIACGFEKVLRDKAYERMKQASRRLVSSGFNYEVEVGRVTDFLKQRLIRKSSSAVVCEK